MFDVEKPYGNIREHSETKKKNQNHKCNGV